MAIPAALAPLVYGLGNVITATGIVFANKAGELNPCAAAADPRTSRSPAARPAHSRSIACFRSV